MSRCVLDTSVIIKSIFKPLKSLPDEVYKREMETHEKCRFIIKKIEEADVDIYIPKVCIVETAAVVKKLADKNLAMKISKFIALAKIKNAALFTDDAGMHMHAEKIGVDSLLIRDTEFKDIEKFILELTL